MRLSGFGVHGGWKAGWSVDPALATVILGEGVVVVPAERWDKWANH